MEGFEPWSSMCQVLIDVYICIACFNSNQKEDTIGDSNRGHQDKNRAPYQCEKILVCEGHGK